MVNINFLEPYNDGDNPRVSLSSTLNMWDLPALLGSPVTPTM